MTRDQAWLVPDSADARPLRPGDIAIMRGPDPYTVADDPATPPQVIIHPGQHCTTPQGEDVSQAMDLGVRTWGNSPHGLTTTLIAPNQMRGEISRRLLGALPTLVALPDDAWDSPLMALLGEEIVKDQPGQEVVLDRLLDLLLVAVLRVWVSRPEAESPVWYRAHSDSVVGRALRILHNNPADTAQQRILRNNTVRPWMVVALATATGVSRAALPAVLPSWSANRR